MFTRNEESYVAIVNHSITSSVLNCHSHRAVIGWLLTNRQTTFIAHESDSRLARASDPWRFSLTSNPQVIKHARLIERPFERVVIVPGERPCDRVAEIVDHRAPANAPVHFVREWIDGQMIVPVAIISLAGYNAV